MCQPVSSVCWHSSLPYLTQVRTQLLADSSSVALSGEMESVFARTSSSLAGMAPESSAASTARLFGRVSGHATDITPAQRAMADDDHTAASAVGSALNNAVFFGAPMPLPPPEAIDDGKASQQGAKKGRARGGSGPTNPKAPAAPKAPPHPAPSVPEPPSKKRRSTKKDDAAGPCRFVFSGCGCGVAVWVRIGLATRNTDVDSRAVSCWVGLNVHCHHRSC